MAAALRGDDRLVEAGQTFDDRAPFGKAAIDVDENRKGILHLAEGVCRLHQSAELYGAGEIGGAHHDVRKHDGSLPVAGCQKGKFFLPRHDRQPVGNDVAEAQQQSVAFGALAFSNAICSEFSRTRTRLKRKSAS